MSKVSTIEVLVDGNIIVINESEFNAEIHGATSAPQVLGLEVDGDITKMSVFDAVELIEAVENFEVLEIYEGQESKGKNRKGIMVAIDRAMGTFE
jgi:hypothetical protein